MTSLFDAVFEEERANAVNLLSSKKLPKLYVEGGLDKYVFSHRFGDITRVVIPKKGEKNKPNFRRGGKNLVREKVDLESDSFGFVDMDHDFNSTFVKSNKRIVDSSPKSCLASLILDDHHTQLFAKKMLEKRGLYGERDLQTVLTLSKAHSIAIWERGMAGEKGFKVDLVDSDQLWNCLLANIKSGEIPLILKGMPNGTGLELFWRANKHYLEDAGVRDHSLIEAIVRYVESKTDSKWVSGTEEIKNKFAGFVKYHPMGGKLERFRKTIEMQRV